MEEKAKKKRETMKEVPKGNEKEKDLARDKLVRLVFGMAVMAALFSGLLISIHLLGLMEYNVSKPESPPVIERFWAEPDTIRPGESSTLIWNVSRARNVSIDAIGPVAPSGNFAVMPKETSNYTLSAANPAGKVEATVTVQVAAEAPEVEDAAEPATAPSKSEPEKVIIRGPVGTV